MRSVLTVRRGEKFPLDLLPAARVPDDMAISGALVMHITALGLDNTANSAVMPSDREAIGQADADGAVPRSDPEDITQSAAR
jgi:hypothetical protein